jgi:cytidine diphosphoramidate kinase
MGVSSQGYVYWITGLSGAGKSTVGQLLTTKLRQAGHSTLYLDGDVLREVFGNIEKHSTADRQRLAMTYARLCREVAKQNLEVVCATVSLFHDVRKWNRDNIPGYREIYLRVPVDELKQRDPKGIYAAFNDGKMRDVVGLDMKAELPETPDLVIENFGDTSSDAAVELIWNKFALPK